VYSNPLRVVTSHQSLVTSLVAFLFFLASCSREPRELVLSGPTMGTTYTVKIAGAPAGIDASGVRAAIDEVLARVDRTMSGYRRDSDISRFNAAATTQWFEVSPQLVTVVQAALVVSAQSAGAFDVTVSPLVNAWGFGPAGEPRALPDAAAIATLREQVGYGKLHARSEPPSLRKDSAALSVDLNGIAPGYAVDRLAERLQSMRIEHFMIDIGGEVRARGRNASGEPWRIAIERPFDTEPEPYAIIALDDAAVTTSGEYRHYYSRNGRRYSHTVDPRTGGPVEHTLASVVVIGPESMYTDAWATAFNVLGTQAGYELAAQRGMPVMFIEARGGRLQSRTTEAFKPYLVAE
jgi:thiamine biosynthesis lipoprotein